MSEDTIAYIAQANREESPRLCVMDRKWGEYHQFTITPVDALRLATECINVVNASVGGSNYNALQDAFRVLSAK